MAEEPAGGGNPAPALIAKLLARGWSHWTIVALVLVIGMLFTEYADEHLRLDVARSVLSQKLLEWNWRAPIPGDIKLVLIGDDAYWQASLEGRVPIRRGGTGNGSRSEPLNFLSASTLRPTSVAATSGSTLTSASFLHI